MNLRVRYRLAIVEAVLVLAFAWCLVFMVPFRRMAAWLGHPTAPGDAASITAVQLKQARCVCRLVTHIERRVPWRTTCLVQAVAGILLLRRRGIAATIRFGVKKSDDVLVAHAWLIVGGESLLGGAAAEGFIPLADMGGMTP